MKGLVILCGAYIVIEAIVSLFWAKNDKWFWSQMVRVSRIIVGIFFVWVGYYYA
jgi:hypothetical protein